MSGPHDNLFKKTFEETQVAAAHFRDSLPAEVVARIDLDQLQLVPGSFVDDALKDRHTDLLFSAPWIDGGSQADGVHEDGESDEQHRALLFVLFEHQSSVDPLMPWRMLCYTVKTWNRWLLENPNAKTLPAIFSLVVFNGRGRWTGPTRLEELVQLPDELRSEFGDILPRLRIVIQSLNTLLTLPGDAHGQVALTFLRDRDPDVAAQMRTCIELLSALPKQTVLRVLHHLLEYAGMVHKTVDYHAVSDAVRPLGRQAQEVAMTYYETLKAEGRVEGRVEEREKLLAQFKLRLRESLDARGIRMSAELGAHIDGCSDLDTVLAWYQRSFVASNVADVFDH